MVAAWCKYVYTTYYSSNDCATVQHPEYVTSAGKVDYGQLWAWAHAQLVDSILVVLYSADSVVHSPRVEWPSALHSNSTHEAGARGNSPWAEDKPSPHDSPRAEDKFSPNQSSRAETKPSPAGSPRVRMNAFHVATSHRFDRCLVRYKDALAQQLRTYLVGLATVPPCRSISLAVQRLCNLPHVWREPHADLEDAFVGLLDHDFPGAPWAGLLPCCDKVVLHRAFPARLEATFVPHPSASSVSLALSRRYLVLRAHAPVYADDMAALAAALPSLELLYVLAPGLTTSPVLPA